MAIQFMSFQRYSIGFYLFGWSITLYPIIFTYVSLRKEWKGWHELKVTFQAIENGRS